MFYRWSYRTFYSVWILKTLLYLMVTDVSTHLVWNCLIMVCGVKRYACVSDWIRKRVRKSVRICHLKITGLKVTSISDFWVLWKSYGWVSALIWYDLNCMWEFCAREFDSSSQIWSDYTVGWVPVFRLRLLFWIFLVLCTF